MVKPVPFVVSGVLLSVIVYLLLLIQNYYKNVICNYPTKSIIDPADYGLNILEYLDKYKYSYEIHHVTTDDGYILEIHRIGKKNFEINSTKPAVLMQHPLFSSSYVYVNLGPKKSLGLMLVDKGWDVWLGNNRGNIYSRRHLNLDPDKDAEFWDYSFEECGNFDITAMVDYIRSKTKQDKIYFIGTSHGNMQFFSMASTRVEYNHKIALAIALGPTAYLTNIRSPAVQFVFKIKTILKFLGESLGLGEIFSLGHKFSLFTKYFCGPNSVTIEICRAFFYVSIGFDPTQFQKDLIPYIIYNIPAGVSLKTFDHLGQNINSDKFKRYDYGFNENLRRYNTSEAPSFNLSAITTPIALYYSLDDQITVFEDVERLYNELPNVVRRKIITKPNFGHLDFVWSLDIDKHLLNDVLELMDGFAQNSSIYSS